MTARVMTRTQSVTRVESSLKPPSMYWVVILNDDYTPMEFVVDVLMRVFAMSLERATQVMLQVHHQGKGLCGVFSRDVAETKASQVITLAIQAGHPLQAKIEAQP